jgi:hypothetical protein
MQRLRKRIHVSPATAIATLALVFAMSGGAYAAKHYLITSTKQISPKVLKSLKGASGNNGAPGAAGPAGPGGAQGAQGAQGPAGPAGAAGAKGGPGPAGTNGTNGTNGTTGFTKTLPSGETETGGWTVSPSAAGIALAPISFSIPLAAPPSGAKVHYVTHAEWSGHTAPAECAGTVAEPSAASGSLCVYEFEGANVKLHTISPLSAGGGPGADTAGAFLWFEAEAGEPRIAWGSWAVTAA